MKKHFGYIVLIIFSIGVAASGCKKDKLLETGGELRFSVDTLTFDTVFTSLGSYTAWVKVYNPQNQPVNVSSIMLEGGDGSQFNINVNGTAGSLVKDIEIAAKDSIYVFATVNVNPNDKDNPFVIQDRLIATLNGRQYTIPLLAYGQNAYYLVDSLITSNQVWNTDKPYVIIRNAYVDVGVTLTIPAGCRIYVHADSRLFVLGTLKVKGTKQDSVIFQGDRLDRKYFGNEGYPGEWGGIYFNYTSHDNEIDYAVIKNVGGSTRLNDLSFTPAAIQLNVDTVDDQKPQLLLTNSIIENSIGHGILAFSSSLVARNCLINTCGAQCLGVFQGGLYYLDNCTFVTYGTDKVSHIDNPVMALLNYFDQGNNSYIVGPLIVEMRNSVVWGSLETEFFADGVEGADFNVKLENCLVKNKDGIAAEITATNCKVNEDPMFKNYSGWDYRPNAGSPLINAGKNIGLLTDLDGKTRDAQPDIGCYEY